MEIKKDRVIELLEDSIRIRRDRNATYSGPSGDAYKTAGSVLNAFFPTGIELKNSDDFNRYAIVEVLILKMMRYCNNFHDGGHDDSLCDIANYSAMLRELDEIELKKTGK